MEVEGGHLTTTNVLLATAPVLAKVPPLTECRSEAPVAAGHYWFRATQAETFFGMHAINSNQIVCIQRRPPEWVEAVLEQRLISPQRVVLLLPWANVSYFQ